MCEVAVPAYAVALGLMLTPTWGVSGPRSRAGVGQVAGSDLDERRSDVECYECGDTATVTRTEASLAECDVVCAVCADYEIAAGYPVFPLAGLTDEEA